MTPVFALAHRLRRDGLHPFGRFDHFARKDVRDLLRMDRDHGDRFFGRDRAQHLTHARSGRAAAPAIDRLDLDQITVLRAVRLAIDHTEDIAPAISRLDTGEAVRTQAEHAQRRALAVRHDLHDPRGRSGLVAANTHENAVADARHQRLAPAIWQDAHAALSQLPLGRNANQIAVAVALDHIENGHGRKGARLVQTLAGLFQRALVLQLAKQVFERDAVLALEIERTSDVALGGTLGVLADEAQHVLAQRRIGRTRDLRFLCPFGTAFGSVGPSARSVLRHVRRPPSWSSARSS